MPIVTPFRPGTSLRRADVLAARAFRDASDAFLLDSRCGRSLEDLVGAPIDFEVVSVERGAPPPPLAGGVAVELTDAVGSVRVHVESEAGLSAAVTARALKRLPPRALAELDPRDRENLAGGLAAVLTAVSRGSHAGPLLPRAAGPSEQVLATRLPRDTAVDAATLRVSIAGEAFLARVFLSPRAPREGRRLSRALLAGLGETPLDVPVVGCVFRATAGALAELEVGDAWRLGSLPWSRGPRGEVVLAAPEAESGARADLGETGALVLRPGITELGRHLMGEQGETDPIIDTVGDVPVLVRVEVGTARMAAREWAALAAGDVVNLRRSTTEPVTLRVGGVEVATGELVDVEGEIAVRILRRVGVDRAP